MPALMWRFSIIPLVSCRGAGFLHQNCFKLTRTYTDRHGLKDVCREFLDVDISKQQQSSDWGADTLSEAQKKYAATDVLHLHGLMGIFRARLSREGRKEMAQSCFDFLPTRAKLDLAGWDETDIFAHS